MVYNPFLFFKKYEERFGDFSSILSSNKKACDIEKGWSDYLELAIEPVGWKAIWRISREICAHFKISFPCTVIVIVKHVNVKELSCRIDIHEVDNDNIDLPETVADVPLIELYPTKEQDHSCALEMFETANLIDSLRFFYHNLWMPWDLQFDEEESWVESHLEGRLQLHFSMLEMRLPEDMVYEVRRLVAEGRKALQCMEDLLESETEAEQSPENLLKITELHNRLSQLRNNYSIYEKPHLLKALVERHQKDNKSTSVTTVVLSSTTPDQLSNLGTHLSTKAEQIRLVPTLQEALVKTRSDGCVYVTQGEHSFQDLASLKTGGSISGLEPGVVLVGDEGGEDCASVDLLKGRLALSRLTLRFTSSWIIMKVRPDTECELSDVQLLGSSVTDGIDVYPGATLCATDCSFTSCQTALVCYPNSTVRLSRCTFTDNTNAIELRDGCHFSMTDCTISGSSKCAVQVPFHPLLLEEDLKKSTIHIINRIPQVKESGTVCTNNSADVDIVNTATREFCNDNSKDVKDIVMEC